MWVLGPTYVCVLVSVESCMEFDIFFLIWDQVYMGKGLPKAIKEHQVCKSAKWCYNWCPLINEVRRCTW